MTRLTPSQLETLRSRPQSSKLDLFIYQPSVAYSMEVAALPTTPAQGDRVITYINATGSYAQVESGMTMLVGSEYGLDDIGRVRVRSITGQNVTVAENSDIPWQAGQKLTILKFWQVWPVFPRIIQNPSNPTDTIFYKDYDILYNGQNATLGTFIQAGSHQPVLISNSTGTVYYTATGTYNLLGNSLTYSWNFEGANVTGSTSQTPGNVYYTTPGDYVTRLRVTASNGATDTTYRYISVRNQIGQGSNTPVVRWSMDDLQGSRSEGGYNVEITVYDNVPISNGSLVMIRSEDYYGNVKDPFGNIFFVGYVQSGSIRYSHDRSYYTFTAESITGVMKEAVGFSVSVESALTPYQWYQLYDMDVRRAIYHYLRWHTTVLSISDFEFRGTDYKIQYFDADRTSLYDAIDNLMRGALRGTICANRAGTIYAEVEPVGYSNPTGSFPSVMTITNRDWMDEPQITEQLHPTTSYLELGGIAYSGVNTGTFSAYLSSAPGESPSYYGKPDTKTGMAILGQSQLNTITGHIWKNINQRFPAIDMSSSLNLRNLDIAPYESVQVIVQPEDTVRNVSINQLYLPTDLTWRWDAKNQIVLTDLTLSGLVNGQSGQTLIIPPDPNDSDFDTSFDGGDFDIPPLPDFVTPDFGIYTDIPIVNPNTLTPCGDDGYFAVNTYVSTWSEQELLGNGTRIANAYFPCVIHPKFPNGTTTSLEILLQWGGDFTPSMLTAYGVDSDGTRVISATQTSANELFGGYYNIVFIFDTLSPIAVNGFEVELQAGIGSIIDSYEAREPITSGVVNATDGTGADLTPGTIVGNYYCVDGSGGPWDNGLGWELYTNYIYEDGIQFGLYFQYIDDLNGHPAGPGHLRTFFQALTGKTYTVTVADTLFFDNSGSLGWTLRNAEVKGRRVELSTVIIKNVCPPP